MNKLTKLLLRITITTLAVIMIFFGINKLLKIKHGDKFLDSAEWDWHKENLNYYRLSDDKFYHNNIENYLLVEMRNFNVPKKAENEKRILVVGDSYVYGTGLTNINYTWWKQLNLRIKEAGYSNVNVYGAGKYNYSTKDELNEILNNDKLIESIDPDLVIIGYVPNDPEEKDENGEVKIKDDWEKIKGDSEIYKKSPALYYELVDRLHALNDEEYDKMIELGNKLGGHRGDARLLYIVQDERLEEYKKVLVDVDKRMSELDIPYFFAMTNNSNMKLVGDAVEVVYEAMNELSIEVFKPSFEFDDLLKKYDLKNNYLLDANQVDNHPGIIWTYNYSKDIFSKLKDDYKFLFENAKMQDINELELNINDTMPFLEINKIKKNVFEFEYPKNEMKKENGSNFLYYPIEKKYIKLNLEYPKDITKVKLTGVNLKSAEIYVNTVDKKYNFDYDEIFKKLMQCKKITNDTYIVEKEITSVNVYASFKSDNDRSIRIEFIE